MVTSALIVMSAVPDVTVLICRIPRESSGTMVTRSELYRADLVVPSGPTGQNALPTPGPSPQPSTTCQRSVKRVSVARTLEYLKSSKKTPPRDDSGYTRPVYVARLTSLAARPVLYARALIRAVRETTIGPR